MFQLYYAGSHAKLLIRLACCSARPGRLHAIPSLSGARRYHRLPRGTGSGLVDERALETALDELEWGVQRTATHVAIHCISDSRGEVSRSMWAMNHRVNNVSMLEIHGKVVVDPPGDRWLSDRNYSVSRLPPAFLDTFHRETTSREIAVTSLVLRNCELVTDQLSVRVRGRSCPRAHNADEDGEQMVLGHMKNLFGVKYLHITLRATVRRTDAQCRIALGDICGRAFSVAGTTERRQ